MSAFKAVLWSPAASGASVAAVKEKINIFHWEIWRPFSKKETPGTKEIHPLMTESNRKTAKTAQVFWYSCKVLTWKQTFHTHLPHSFTSFLQWTLQRLSWVWSVKKRQTPKNESVSFFFLLEAGSHPGKDRCQTLPDRQTTESINIHVSE